MRRYVLGKLGRDIFAAMAGMSVACVCAAQDPVLVTRGDMSLTRADYEAALSVVPKERRETMTPSVKQTMVFLEAVMVYRKLAQEARELGLDQDPVVAQEMRQAADRSLGLRRLEALEAGLKIPDFTAAAQERYLVKKADFTVPEAVRAAHILIATKDRSDAEALNRAKQVRAKAVSGADFTALAREYSDDPSKDKNDGDLGMFGRKQMVKPFEDAAFAMTKPGEISPVVKSQFGYHIIRLAEKQPERVKPFDEVKDGLIKELRDKYISDAKMAHISAIKNDKSIIINEAAIEAMFKK